MNEPDIRRRPLRLYRSRSDRMLAGVCGGLAQYMNVDPIVVRLVAIALALATGIGVVAYIAMAIVVPNRPADLTESGIDEVSDGRHAREVVAYALIAIGLIALVGNLGVFQFVRPEIVWPAAVVVIGILYLTGRRRD